MRSVEVPQELHDRLVREREAYDRACELLWDADFCCDRARIDAQDALRGPLDAVKAEIKAIIRDEDDLAFVRRQRPWWSDARCRALVKSRRRPGRKLRWFDVAPDDIVVAVPVASKMA